MIIVISTSRTYDLWTLTSAICHQVAPFRITGCPLAITAVISAHREHTRCTIARVCPAAVRVQYRRSVYKLFSFQRALPSKRSAIEVAFSPVCLSVCLSRLSVRLPSVSNAPELWVNRGHFAESIVTILRSSIGLCCEKNNANSSVFLYVEWNTCAFVTALQLTVRYEMSVIIIIINTKRSRFSTNISLHLGNVTRYGHSYNGRRIGTRMRSTEWYNFQ